MEKRVFCSPELNRNVFGGHRRICPRG